MRSYLPVPSSWYLILLGVNFGAASESNPVVALTNSLAGHHNTTSDACMGSDPVYSYSNGKLHGD
jgi:hypothetical protein